MKNDYAPTITGIAPLIRRKKLSPVELTKFFLDRIAKLQPSLNAFITITAELALKQARQAEREIAKGNYRGALHGIPINLKDLIYTKGIKTTAGSEILRDFVPAENAPIVDRLFAAGCILLGKTNMHEFAYGPTNINPHYGPVRNPWDITRMSGGSSGGSAASVVTAQSMASFGTDTGGSIRIPSAACGCVGFKPTYGALPLMGIIPLSSTLDHVGPICRSASDAAILFGALAPNIGGKPEDLLNPRSIKKMRDIVIGIPRQYFFDHVDAAIQKAIAAAIKELERLGAKTREVDLKGMEETAEIAAAITGAEAFAFHEEWTKSEPEKYGRDVLLRLRLSRKMSASLYIKFMKKREAYVERFNESMRHVDVLAAPTLPIIAPELSQNIVRIGKTEEDVRLALLRLTRPGNLTGFPAITLPCGFSRNKLPIGLQLIGKRNEDSTLLNVACAYENATSWHEVFPPDVLLP